MKTNMRQGLMQYVGLTLALVLLVAFFSLKTRYFFSCLLYTSDAADE